MDLEYFPHDKTAKRMMNMISPIYDRSYVGKWIFEAMGQELGLAVMKYMDLENQVFPDTATWLLPAWEQMYGIASDPSKPYEQRRKEIQEKRYSKRPMNPARISQLISRETGRNVYVNENTAPSTYEVCIEPGSSSVDLNNVLEIIKNAKQSNKHVDVVFAVPITAKIRVDPEISGKAQPFILSGTKPDVNTVGSLEQSQIILESEQLACKKNYKASGAVVLDPEVNTLGKFNQHGLASEITSTVGISSMKACGSVGLKRGGI